MDFNKVKEAFRMWEADYRVNSRSYATIPEMFASPEDELAHDRTVYFLALIEEIS